MDHDAVTIAHFGSVAKNKTRLPHSLAYNLLTKDQSDAILLSILIVPYPIAAFLRVSLDMLKQKPGFLLLLLLAVGGVVFTSCVPSKSTKNTDIPPAKDTKVTIQTQKTNVPPAIDTKATIQQVKKLICNLTARGFSDWVFIERAEEIPHQKGDLKNLVNYTKQIQPPSLKRIDNRSLVTLYTWTENDGLLAKWTATVEEEKVTFLRGEVIDVAVGHYNPLPVEGRFLPVAGDLLVNESVDSLSIGDNSSCRDL